MEQEIAALKAKLTMAEDRVKELEASKVSQRGLERKMDTVEVRLLQYKNSMMLILLTKQCYPSKMSIEVWVISFTKEHVFVLIIYDIGKTV